MNIITVRRISQIFFLVLFLWFCVVSSFGQRWWQLRGWPVNWILQLDPLVASCTILTTRTLYAGLAWALLTMVSTVPLGRFLRLALSVRDEIPDGSGTVNSKFAERVAANHYTTDRRSSSTTCSSDYSRPRPGTYSPIFSMWRGNGP